MIAGSKNVNQQLLEQALSNIFSSSRIKNARKRVSIIHPTTGKYLEVDVWYPDLKLCFEFQDDYHYKATWYHQKPLYVVQETDTTKRALLLQKGQTFIPVPCWWDGKEESLQATIKFHRPDLLQDLNVAAVISANPPFKFFSDIQLMLASFPISLSHVEVSDNRNWWVGEKYDGVRCFWNPQEKQMYSRYGVVIDLHSRMRKLFGKIVLDGEIWCGRGLFFEAKFLVHTEVEMPNWTLFRVLCFDEASHSMRSQPFEQRYSLIMAQFRPSNPTVIIAPRFLCSDAETLIHSLQQIVKEGGEGIILRKPYSLYQPGRSTDLIKLKDSGDDQEALVMDVEEDGSLVLQLSDGTNFVVPKANCILHRRALSGDVVSFKNKFHVRNVPYGQLASQVSQTDEESRELKYSIANNKQYGAQPNVIVYRIREDLSWKDVSSDFSVLAQPNLHGKDNPPRENVPYYERNKIVREKLENLARAQGSDPLTAETWHKIPDQEFLRHKVVRKFVQKYHSSNWPKALMTLFPEINIQASKFKIPYVSIQERKLFFDNFAKGQRFDPLIADNWYSFYDHPLLRNQRYETIMTNYKSLPDCLMHLYPNIGIQKEKFFAKFPAQDRKLFFDNFAKAQGFDPLVADNWYGVSMNSLSQNSECKAILKYYSNLPDCLVHLYPDIGLNSSKFLKVSNYEQNRTFLDNFAANRGYDPLIPDNWYNVSLQFISQYQALGNDVLLQQYLKGQWADYVIHHYPNIGLQKSKFAKVTTRALHRSFFDLLAATLSFDPLVSENWYRADPIRIEQSKGYHTVMRCYRDKRLATCLMQIYPDIGLQKSNFSGSK
eukprot:Phypoly_transcript_03020.p1 GENE.Phypoly_transcript_03020~~Phypoly_transcript_03020.p1  ORF type:complete len:828 (+),score=99.94 Phypoly_transcript_03020:42-2525(+)